MLIVFLIFTPFWLFTIFVFCCIIMADKFYTFTGVFLVMKKLFSAALILAVVFSLCGCNATPPSVKEIESALIKSSAFSDNDNLIALETKQLEERFGFSGDLLDGFSVHVSKIEDDICEFGIFDLKDSDDVNTVIDAIKRYLNPVTVDETNTAEVTPNLVLMKSGSCVIFAVSPKRDVAEATLASLGAEEIN